MSQNNNNDKDSKKLLDQKPVEGGEMKKGADAAPPKGAKDGKKDPKAPKEEELVRLQSKIIFVRQKKIFS